MSEKNKRMVIHIDKFFFVDLIGAVYVLYSLSGDTSGKYLYLSAVLFFGWCIIAVLTSKTKFQNSINDKKVFMMLVFILYGIICGLIKGPLLFVIKQAGAVVLSFSPMIMYGYYRQINTEKLRKIIVFTIVAWTYFSIKSLLFYGSNAGAARLLARSEDAFGNIAIGGGYPFAYGSALLAVCICTLLAEKRVRSMLYKAFLIVFIVLLTFVIVETRSSVTLLCFVTGMLLAIIYKETLVHSKAYSYKVFQSFILVVIMIFLATHSEELGRQIILVSNHFQSIVGRRLMSLGYALIGDADGSYAIDRLTLPLVSLKTFAAHPIFGVSYLHGNGFISSALFGVSRHSEWADTLANYGLIGGLLFLGIYIAQIKDELKRKNHIGIAWIITLVLLGTFNPINSFQANFIVFFVIPAINSLYEEKSIR